MEYVQNYDTLIDIIQRQRDFQDRVDGRYAEDILNRIDYIRDMVQAANVELVEALNETTWKPWTSPAESKINADALVGELIDVLCFWVNILLAAKPGTTPRELADLINEHHLTKVTINHKRQDDGYDGTNKCPECKRALDDPGVTCEVSDSGHHCAATGITHLNNRT